MAVRDIIQGDVPALRTPAQPVVRFDDGLQHLVMDIRETLAFHRGLALAATQIGEPLRIVVIDIGHGTQEFINPEINVADGEQKGFEASLSFPDHTLNIKRPARIVVNAQDQWGQPIHLEACGLLARLLCHGIDHLNGVLFMDHLSEEEMFAQLMSSALVMDVNEDDMDGEPDVDPMNDITLAIDMFSELAWKFTLCLELFRDDEALSRQLDFEQLQQLESQLQRIAEQLENVEL